MTEMIEKICRAMCARRGTGQCAAVCLSHSSNFTAKGGCPEAGRVFKEDARAALSAMREPTAEIINKWDAEFTNKEEYWRTVCEVVLEAAIDAALGEDE